MTTSVKDPQQRERAPAPLPTVPRWRRRLRPYLLSVPAVAIIIGILYPFLLGVYYSFLNYSAVNPNPVWIGIRNFRNVLTDPEVVYPRKSNLA